MSQLVVEDFSKQDHQPIESVDSSIRIHLEHFEQIKDTQLIKRTLKKLKKPKFEDLLKLARYEFEDQNFSACLDIINYALEIRGQELKGLQEAYRLHGACLIQVGQLENAEDSLYKALEYPGETDAVLVNLGTLDIQRKSWESATISFREALRLNSNNDKAWVGLSLCHRFKGDHQLAFGNLEVALDCQPTNETALGLLMAWYGDTKETVIYNRLSSYLVSGGQNENLWLSFVEVAKKKGDFLIADLELERLKLTHPEFAPAYQLRR